MLQDLLTFIAPALPWLALCSLVSLLLVAIAVPVIVVRLPANYFTRRDHAEFAWRGHHPLVYVPLMIVKNTVAALLLALGAILLFLPGQGVLTMVVGVLLLDFPGKYRLERWLVCRPRMLAAFNRLRARAGRPPFDVTRGG